MLKFESNRPMRDGVMTSESRWSFFWHTLYMCIKFEQNRLMYRRLMASVRKVGVFFWTTLYCRGCFLELLLCIGTISSPPPWKFGLNFDLRRNHIELLVLNLRDWREKGVHLFLLIFPCLDLGGLDVQGYDDDNLGVYRTSVCADECVYHRFHHRHHTPAGLRPLHERRGWSDRLGEIPGGGGGGYDGIDWIEMGVRTVPSWAPCSRTRALSVPNEHNARERWALAGYLSTSVGPAVYLYGHPPPLIQSNIHGTRFFRLHELDTVNHEHERLEKSRRNGILSLSWLQGSQRESNRRLVSCLAGTAGVHSRLSARRSDISG